MATKNIAITEKAYNTLARYKKPGESFSEVIVENFGKNRSILDYAGIWSDVSEDDWRSFKKSIREAKSGIDKSMDKRIRTLK